MEIPSISPERVFIGNFSVGITVITAFAVTAFVFVFGLIFKYVLVPRFKTVPPARSFQNVIELLGGGVRSYARSVLGNKYGDVVAPYIMTIFTFVILGGFTEYMGVRSPATDLNCTAGLALVSFVLIIAFSIRYRGVKGWLKTYAEPKAFMAPINVLSAVAIPISLACRMFGNLFSGLLIMDMIYSGMGHFAIGVPGLASLYLIIFHVAMQSYVFTMLTMSFMKEKLAMED